ncbi:MAG: arylamine N-acetyltransferase [Opitutus sp.]
MIDLDAYFARIGYTGSRSPTAETLSAIHAHHARTIPFENLDVLLGRGIRIDPAAISEKLVQAGRGGYCFEQNGLMMAVLRALGFTVTPLLARVRWQVPAEISTALTHLILRVECEAGAFLADVGFGSMSLYRPLAFELDREQTVAMERRRLVLQTETNSAGGPPLGVFAHQAQIGSDWLDVYRFTGEPVAEVDCEVGNWFTSCHPQSRFVQNLVASRCEEDHRCTLFNREFTIRHRDGRVVQRTLASPDELLRVLADHFKLHLPAGTRFPAPGLNWTE